MRVQSVGDIHIAIHDYVVGFDSYSIYTSDRLQGKYAREQVYYIYVTLLAGQLISS